MLADIFKDLPDDLELKDLDPMTLKVAGLQILAGNNNYAPLDAAIDPNEFVLIVHSTENKKLHDHLSKFQVLDKPQTGKFAISLLEMMLAADYCIKEAKVKDQQSYKTVFSVGFEKPNEKGTFFKFNKDLGDLKTDSNMQFLASGVMENLMKSLMVRKSLSGLKTVGDFKQNLTKRENFLSKLANVLEQPLALKLHEGCQKKYRASLEQGFENFLKQEDVSKLNQEFRVLVKCDKDLVLEFFSKDLFSYCKLKNGDQALMVRCGADLKEVLDVAQEENLKLEFFDSEKAFTAQESLSQDRLSKLALLPEEQLLKTKSRRNPSPESFIQAIKVLNLEFPFQEIISSKTADGAYSIVFNDPNFDNKQIDKLKNEGRLDKDIEVNFDFHPAQRKALLEDAQGKKINYDEKGDFVYFIISPARCGVGRLNAFLNGVEKHFPQSERQYQTYSLGKLSAVKVPLKLLNSQEPEMKRITDDFLMHGLFVRGLGDLFSGKFLSVQERASLVSETKNVSLERKGISR